MWEDSCVSHLNTPVSPLQGCGWSVTTESCCSLDLFPPGYHHWSSSNLFDVGWVVACFSLLGAPSRLQCCCPQNWHTGIWGAQCKVLLYCCCQIVNILCSPYPVSEVVSLSDWCLSWKSIWHLCQLVFDGICSHSTVELVRPTFPLDKHFLLSTTPPTIQFSFHFKSLVWRISHLL